MTETHVAIPVEFVATYEDGKITKMVVLPQESNAGYFGPPSQVFDGDADLDVTSTDGPFWRAMQGALGTVPIGWEE